MEGAPGRSNAGTVHAVRRDTTRMGASEEAGSRAQSDKNAACRVNVGNPKRVKRREARHSPGLRAKARGTGRRLEARVLVL